MSDTPQSKSPETTHIQTINEVRQLCEGKSDAFKIGAFEAFGYAVEQQRDEVVVRNKNLEALIKEYTENHSVKSLFKEAQSQIEQLTQERDSLREQLKEAIERADHAVNQYLKDQLPADCKDWEQVWNQRTQIQEENQSLMAQVAVMVKAHEKACGCLAFFRSVIKCGEEWSKTCELDFAKATQRPEITPAAKELLERVKRMEEFLIPIAKEFGWYGIQACKALGVDTTGMDTVEIVKKLETLSTTQPPAKEPESLYDSLRGGGR